MKRLELTAVPAPQTQKKVKWKQSSHRFVLILGESNSETCPEYSFGDLVKNEKPMNGNLFDDQEDEDRDVAAIAQRFEAKYGPKSLYSGKRKRTQEMDDFYDPGEGYDEDDPFIDNTEAHDEVVPSTLITQHGGFYINQGKLDFKCLEEDSLDEFHCPQVMKKKKKRVLDSGSDEEETGAAIAKKFKAMKAMKRKRQLESKDGGTQKKKKISGDDMVVIKKKKIKNLDKLNMQIGQVKLVRLDDLNISKSTPESSTQKEVVAPSGTLANGTVGDLGAENEDDLEEEMAGAALPEDSSSKSGDEGKGDNQQSEKNTVLPSQLPAELREAIEKIKREAKETKEKRLKFFSADVNQLLLDIDLRSRSLPWGSRTAIFGHLSEHLPAGKHTLLRRAKKLRESQEEGQLKVPMQKLKEAIMKVMPSLEEQHELEVQKVKNESGLKDDIVDGKEEASTESEEEDKSDNKKKPRRPQRKFQWNPEIRDLMLLIVSTKMKLYNVCKSRNQTAEEYLKAFLDSELKPLWPQGWMQARMLFKESRSVHEDLTKSVLQQGKQKKTSAGFEAPPSIVESARLHTSRTEDVIEISSNMESDDENNSVVIVDHLNLGVSDAKSVTPQVGAVSHAGAIPSSAAQVSQPPSKTTVSSIPVSSQSAPVNTTLSQKDISSTSTLKRVVPTPVVEPTTPKSITTTKPFSPGFLPNAASSPGVPASNTQQHHNSKSSIQQQNSQQHKLSLQHKSVPPQQMSNTQQQKLAQESNKVTNMQQIKAAKRSPVVVVNKDISNSPLNKVNSVVPTSKSNPVVAVNRITENHAQKPTLGSKPGQSQMPLPQNQQAEKVFNNSGFKPNQMQKKHQQGSGSSSPSVSSGGTSDPSQIANKSGAVSQAGVVSSKPELQNRTFLQQQGSNLPNNLIKSPSSVQKLGQQHQQNVKAATVIGASSQLTVQTDFPSNDDRDIVGEYSPPGRLLPVPSSASSPPSIITAGLLNITTTASLSRSSTPSPQKSPASPQGNAALSLYEQIKSQIWQQDAMEDQALKNLALALKYGGSNTSTFFGK